MEVCVLLHKIYQISKYSGMFHKVVLCCGKCPTEAQCTAGHCVTELNTSMPL